MIFWTPLHGHTKVGINIIVRAIHVLLEQFFFRLTELPSGVNLSYSYPIPHVPHSCLLLILLVYLLVRTCPFSYSYYLYPPFLLVSLGSGIICRLALRIFLADTTSKFSSRPLRAFLRRPRLPILDLVLLSSVTLHSINQNTLMPFQ